MSENYTHDMQTKPNCVSAKEPVSEPGFILSTVVKTAESSLNTNDNEKNNNMNNDISEIKEIAIEEKKTSVAQNSGTIEPPVLLADAGQKAAPEELDPKSKVALNTEDEKVFKNVFQNVRGIEIDDHLIYLYLIAIEGFHGKEIRNAFGYVSKDFLKVNRLYCVREIVIEEFGEESQLYDLLKDFSSLECVSFKNCENFSNTMFHVLAKEKPADVDETDEFWDFLTTQKRLALEFKKRINLPMEINRLKTLNLNKHINKNSGELQFKFMPNIEVITVTNSESLKSISFLASLEHPETLRSLVLDHCSRLSLFEQTELIKKDVNVTKELFEKYHNADFKGVKYYKTDHGGELLSKKDFDNNNSDDNEDIIAYKCNQYIFFDYIRLFQRFKNLTHLSLVRTRNVDPKLLKFVSENCANINLLNLHSCDWVSDHDMFHVRRMPMIDTLILASIPNITVLAIIILCYINKKTVQSIVENKELFIKIMSKSSNSCIINDNDADCNDNMQKDLEQSFTRAELELLKQNVCLLILNSVDNKHFSENSAQIIQMYEKFINYNFFFHDTMEGECQDFISPLRRLDISYCYGIESLDLKIFSNLLFLKELNVTGCDLFAPCDSLDNELFEKLSAEKREIYLENHVISKKDGVDKILSQKDCDKDALENISRLQQEYISKNAQYFLSIEYLDIQHCTISSYHKNSQLHTGHVINPIKENIESKETIENFNLLFLKYTPFLRCFRAGNSLRMTSGSLFYTFFNCPNLIEITLDNAIHLNMRKFFMNEPKNIKTVPNNQKIKKTKKNKSANSKLSIRSPSVMKTYLTTNGGQQIFNITLSNVKSVNDKSLEDLCKCLPNLTELNLSECDELTNNGLKSIHSLRNLQVLSLAFCVKLNDDAFKDIDKTNPHLQILDLSGTSIRSKALKNYLYKLPNLVNMGLDQCNFINDKSLLHFIIKSPQLKNLSLVKNEAITKAMLAMLQLDPKFSDLKILY